MATKNNPGQYDCYNNAEPDEPLFVLLGRHWLSGHFAAAWAFMRCGMVEEAKKCLDRAAQQMMAAGKSPLRYDDPKITEANACAKAMAEYWLAKRYDELEQKCEDVDSVLSDG